MKIKAISLHQPWASLVAHDHKRIETRSWRCPLSPGSLLAIHAAKKWNKGLADLCCATLPFENAMRSMGVHVDSATRRLNLPFGAVVCVVRLDECLPIVGTKKPTVGEKCVGFDEDKILRVWHPFFIAGHNGHSGDGYQQVAEYEAAFGNYTAGRFAWLFDAALPFAPVAERGRQSLWDWEVPEELRAAVETMRGEA